MKIILVIVSLLGASAFASRTEDVDRNKFDFYRLRMATQKFQRGEASIEEVKQALAALRHDGFKEVVEPEKLTAEQAQSMTVVAENTCGVVKIQGPAGIITGFSIPYTNSTGEAAALAKAQNYCVSGFTPVSISSGSSAK